MPEKCDKHLLAFVDASKRVVEVNGEPQRCQAAALGHSLLGWDDVLVLEHQVGAHQHLQLQVQHVVFVPAFVELP